MVANAALTLTNSATGTTRTSASDAEGRYVLPALEPGRYTLRAEKPPLSGSLRSIAVSVNDALALDLTLTIADRREQVTVEAAAAVLETQSATLSGFVDSRRVIDLPLNGRNFAQLVPLQPGVAIISSQGLLGGGPDAAGIQGSGQYVNGARSSVNSFLFDGGEANDPVVPSGTGAASTAIFTGGAPGVNAVSVDAIQEFRVLTSGANAEFGRSSGATVNVITKSGTNQLRGTLFHFLRNRQFNARNTFEATRPGFTQNNFGGTVGGPIRRDRTFFFASYEGFRQRQAVSVVNAVPSPNTIAAAEQQNALLGSLLRAYFSGAAAARPGTFAERSVQDILASQQPVVGTAVLARGNGVDQDAGLGRLDHHFAGGSRLNARYQVFEAVGLPGTISGTGIAGSNIGYTNRSQNAVIGHTKAFGAARLNEFRAVFQRNSPRSTFEATPQAVLAAGRLRTIGPYARQPYGDPGTDNGIPTIATLGFGLTSLGYETTAPNARGANTYQVTNTFTGTRGGHMLKAGGDFRRIQENSLFSFRLRPEISFASGGATSFLAPNAPVFSYDQNIFLTPATSLRGFRLSEWAGFVQDTWRVSGRLTIDAGLRFEYFGRPGEVNGYLNNGFLTANGVPLNSAGILSQGSGRLNSLRMVPVGPGRDFAMYAADRNNLAPRAGFAWRWTERTVVRGSYGIFYDRIFNNVFGNARNSAPYTLLVTQSGVPFGSLPAADAFTTTLPIGPVTINPTLRSPLTHRFHVGVQRQVGGSAVAEVSYVGALGRSLVRTLRPNMGPAFPADFRPANIDPAAGAITFDNYRPLVYGNVSTRDSSGASEYHSLQARFEKRFARGLSFQANYTYGRATDIASGEILTDVVVTTISNRLAARTADGRVALPSLPVLQQVNPALRTVPEAARFYQANFAGPDQWAADWGNAAFDVRHIFVANGSYELPWGRQRWWGAWQVNGMLRMQSGVPMTLHTGLDVNGDGNAPDRAALLSGDAQAVRLATGRQFFAPSVLGRGENGQPVRTFAGGTLIGVSSRPGDVASYLPRNALHGPPMHVLDLSLLKRFTLAERAVLQFRAEAFNLMNATNLSNPVVNTASPAFGQVLSTATPPRQVQLGLRLEF